MFPFLEIAALTSLIPYLCQRRAHLRHRNLKTWQDLAAEVRQYPADSTAPWIRFQNARVVLEMTDYLEINGSSVSGSLDQGRLVSIRKEAMTTRLSLLATVVRASLSSRKG